jgi:hypothetical protein
MDKQVKEIGMFMDPVGYKKSEPNPADLVYTKEYRGDGMYDIFKNRELKLKLLKVKVMLMLISTNLKEV